MQKERKEIFIIRVLFIVILVVLAYAFFRKPIIAVKIPIYPLKKLPLYSLYSLMRVVIAYFFSLIFAIFYGFQAASTEKKGRIMIPILDILQSVPILGFFPAAIYIFINLIPFNHRLGLELAAIFLIFTSQVWNMAFGVYESLLNIPKDIKESYNFFDSKGILIIRKLYLPSIVPKLTYNSMLSWSSGWFFLVACEIIALGETQYRLPGLGSFLMENAAGGNWLNLFIGLFALILIIVIFDIFAWKPLVFFSKKFLYEFSPASGEKESEFTKSIFSFYSELFSPIIKALNAFYEKQITGLRKRKETFFSKHIGFIKGIIFKIIFVVLIILFIIGVKNFVLSLKFSFLKSSLIVIPATFASFLRILIAYVIALLWTYPASIFISNNEKAYKILSPLSQIFTSIPAVSLFPLILAIFLPFKFGLEIASIVLLLTGMQWYLLFNLIGGLKAIPKDLKESVESFKVKKMLKFRRLLFPASFSSLITGSITAWGGGWNALIVSEYINIKNKTYSVLGIGSILNKATLQGNTPLLIISLFVMIITIVSFNRLVFRRLYNLSVEKYKME